MTESTLKSKQKIDEIQQLQKEIEELENFLYTVTTYVKNERCVRTVSVFIKKQTITSLSIFGSRFFGSGTNTEMIPLPNELRNVIIKECEIKIESLKEELSKLILI